VTEAFQSGGGGASRQGGVDVDDGEEERVDGREASRDESGGRGSRLESSHQMVIH